MTEMHKFKQALVLSDRLINIANKEELAECARLLAINIAHYESVHGSLSIDKTLEMAYAEEPNQAQIDLMVKGMEMLIGVLGGILQGFKDKVHH